jgi:uncharacterized protein (TIGR02217 family)
MSNSVFPTLAGLAWSVTKSPMFATKVQSAVSGKELRTAYMPYPLWKFHLTYEVLRADVVNAELQSLMGFFLSRQGAYDSFLYTDPTDYSVTNQQFGTGDGSTKSFQLTRTYGGFSEPVQNVNGTPTIKDNGTTKATPADYSINSTGLVTFVTAPVSGHALTWTGSFYYRVRFLQDVADFDNFMHQLWQLKKLELQSVKL